MNKIIFLNLVMCSFITSGCTYNISMVHTEGQASDVIDSTQSAEPDISPNISIPASVI